MPDSTLVSSFWQKLTRDCFYDDCWLFQYRREPQYYHVQYAPYYTIGGKSIQAHRVAYELAYGPIPTGVVVRHRCAVGGCCNPRHLLLGTQKQNSWDRYAREWAGVEMGKLATYEDIPDWPPPPFR